MFRADMRNTAYCSTNGSSNQWIPLPLANESALFEKSLVILVERSEPISSLSIADLHSPVPWSQCPWLAHRHFSLQPGPYLPSWHTCSHWRPVKPGAQRHCPVSLSHVPPFSHWQIFSHLHKEITTRWISDPLSAKIHTTSISAQQSFRLPTSQGPGNLTQQFMAVFSLMTPYRIFQRMDPYAWNMRTAFRYCSLEAVKKGTTHKP